MKDSASSWDHAQKRERHYYENRAQSHGLGRQVYAESHSAFWKGILSRLPEVEFRDDGYYVDVGCGPNPILTFADRGTRVGIDPLMRFYEESFVFSPDLLLHQGTIEEMSPVPDGQVDVIFSMNNIDHIQDLSRAIRTLRRKLKDTGYLIVSVNVVESHWARILSKRLNLYKLLDPTHTYHFHSPQEVASHLAPQFTLLRHECIEDLTHELEKRKREASTSRSTILGCMERVMKHVKNHIILREKLHLFVFQPEQPNTQAV